MPTIVKLRVFEARDLPIMDSQSQLTDAYVTITFADLPSQKVSISLNINVQSSLLGVVSPGAARHDGCLRELR